MKRKILKTTKIISFILLFIISFIVVSIFVLSSSFGNKYLSDFISEKLEETLNTKVKIGDFSTNIISDISIKEFEIFDNTESNSALLLYLGELEIDYSITDLIFGELNIESVKVNSLDIAVDRDSLGRFNFNTFSDTTDSSTFDTPIMVQNIKITDFNIKYDDKLIPINFDCHGLQGIVIKNESQNSYNIEIAIDSSRLEYFSNPMTFNNIFLTAVLDENFDVKVDSIIANISDLTFIGNIGTESDNLVGEFDVSGNLKHFADVISEESLSFLSDDLQYAKLKLEIENLSSTSNYNWELFSPQYTILDIPFSKININGRYAGDKLSFSEISCNYHEGNIRSNGEIQFDSLLNYNFKLTAQELELTNLLKQKFDAEEFKIKPIKVNLEVNSKGQLESLQSINFNSQISLYQNKDKILSSLIKFSKNKLSISSDSSLINIFAKSEVTSDNIHGSFTTNIDSIAPLFSFLNIENIEGGFFADGTFNGNLTSVNFSSNLYTDGIRFRNVPIIDSAFISVNNNGGKIEIDSSYILGTIDDIIPLAQLVDLDSLDGSLKYSFSAKGTMENPTANVNIEIDSLKYRDYLFEKADLSLQLLGDTIDVEKIELIKDSLQILGTGKIDYTGVDGNLMLQLNNEKDNSADTLHMKFEYEDQNSFSAFLLAKNFAIKNITPLFSQNINYGGLFSGELNISKDQDKLNAEMPFIFTKLSVDSLVIDSINGSLLLNDNKIIADSIIASVGNNNLFFSSSIDIETEKKSGFGLNANSKTKGKAFADSLDLQLINIFMDNNYELNGHSQFDLSWDGTVADPNLNGEISFENANFNFGKYNNLLDSLNGSITFSDSTIRIDSITVLYDKKPLLLNASVSQNNEENYSLLLNLLSDNKTLISSKGSFDNESVNFEFDADSVDISFARPFIQKFGNMKGSLSSKINIIGSFENPNFTGSVDLTGVSGNPDLSNLSIKEGEIHANISQNKVTIDKSYFDFTHGYLAANGELEYDNNSIKDMNFNLKGSNINISEPKIIELNLREFDLTLSTIKDKYKLSGELQLGETNITTDFTTGDLWDILASRTETVLEGPNDEELDLLQIIKDDPLFSTRMPDFINQIEFDLSLTNSDSIWFKNNVAEMRTSLDLDLSGNYEVPFLSGQIKVMEDGIIYFLDREFEITNGVIEFTDPKRINPFLNITAEGEVTETLENSDKEIKYYITFKIIGPADDFDFIFFSEPFLEFDDIVSLLTIGVTYEHLQSSENTNAILQKRAQVLATLGLSKQLNSIFGDEIGEYLLIDYIGVSGNIFDKDEARVEIKKNMFHKLEMSYSTSIESFSKQILKIKYKINDYFYWEGKADQEGESSAGITFRIKFK